MICHCSMRRLVQRTFGHVRRSVIGCRRPAAVHTGEFALAMRASTSRADELTEPPHAASPANSVSTGQPSSAEDGRGSSSYTRPSRRRVQSDSASAPCARPTAARSKATPKRVLAEPAADMRRDLRAVQCPQCLSRRLIRFDDMTRTAFISLGRRRIQCTHCQLMLSVRARAAEREATAVKYSQYMGVFFTMEPGSQASVWWAGSFLDAVNQVFGPHATEVDAARSYDAFANAHGLPLNFSDPGSHVVFAYAPPTVPFPPMAERAPRNLVVAPMAPQMPPPMPGIGVELVGAQPAPVLFPMHAQHQPWGISQPTAGEMRPPPMDAVFFQPPAANPMPPPPDTHYVVPIPVRLTPTILPAQQMAPMPPQGLVWTSLPSQQPLVVPMASEAGRPLSLRLAACKPMDTAPQAPLPRMPLPAASAAPGPGG